MKGFALGLALKQRRKATRKWSIVKARAFNRKFTVQIARQQSGLHHRHMHYIEVTNKMVHRIWSYFASISSQYNQSNLRTFQYNQSNSKTFHTTN